jgi:hypothetical protein
VFGDDAAFALAAGLVERVLGLSVQDERHMPIGRVEPGPKSDDVTRVAHLVKQYGEFICLLERVGVDVVALCREHTGSKPLDRVRGDDGQWESVERGVSRSAALRASVDAFAVRDRRGRVTRPGGAQFGRRVLEVAGARRA